MSSPLLTVLAALLIPMPIVWVNPDFARTPLEWVELAVAMLLVTTLAGLSGAAAWRLRGAPAAAGARAAIWLWLAIGTATVGAVVGDVQGVVLALFPFGFVAFRGTTRTRGVRTPSPALACTTTLSVVFLVAWTLGTAKPKAPRHQLVMIGLDGATWPIIDALREQGRLPTFDRLVAQGARGDLDTLSPTISPPLWTTIASGRRPTDHGVKDFWATARDVRVKRLWEIADERGLLSGVLGYLVTWPPEKKGGFLVPGWLAQGPETVPPELGFLKRLEIVEKTGTHPPLSEMVGLTFQALQHGLTISTANTALAFAFGRSLTSDKLQVALGGRLTKIGLTTDVFCHMLRQLQPDLAIYYESSIDATQHLFFKYYEPTRFPGVSPTDAASYGGAIPRMYEAADTAIARIMSAATTNATVLVVSDHGQEAAPLDDEQWFVIRTTRLLRHLGIENGLRATNSGTSVFLRATGVPATPWPLLDLFRSVVTVPDGEPLFRIEERGPGEASLTVRPGFSPRVDQRVKVDEVEVPASDVVDVSARISGVHTTTAMLLIAGPDVQRATVLPRGHILDVASTALALLRLPVARDMEGRTIIEAFRDEVRADLPIGFVDTYGAPDRVSTAAGGETLDGSTIEQLRTLGYVE